MTLVDTSAWVDFLRSATNPVGDRLEALRATDGAIAITDPVRMELLSGVRHLAGAESVLRAVQTATHLPFIASVDFDGAARIFRACRARGINLRDKVDCMIATVAIRKDVPILAADVDFARIASVVPLQLDPATPTD